MSDVMTPCPPDHPLMIAWTAWKAGADYQNDLRWIATGPQYVEGALWSAFSAGFNHPPTPPPPSETAVTDRRICPTCCHFRDADVPCSDAFHIAPPSETKLSEALDTIEANRAEVTRLYDQITPDFVPPDSDFEKYLEPIRAARFSLESLYREQMAERDEALASVEASAYELIRLRSLQLTPAEANLLLGAMKHAGYDGPLSEPTREKLQRISSKATSEEL